METIENYQDEKSSKNIKLDIEERRYNTKLYFNIQLVETKKILLISIIISILSGLIAYRFYIVGEASSFEIFIPILICIISICFDFGIIFHDLPRLKRIMQLIENDIDEAESIMIKEKINKEKSKIRQAEFEARQAEIQERKNAIEHPECPTCKSHNTRKITTANRATSVATFGLASGKIGKSFECKNCGYKW